MAEEEGQKHDGTNDNNQHPRNQGNDHDSDDHLGDLMALLPF